MLLVEQLAAMADVEVAHLALGAARIEAPATAGASTARDRIEQRVAPGSQPLRGNSRGLRHLALYHMMYKAVRELSVVEAGAVLPGEHTYDVSRK